jgi:hypothetical protein
MIDMVLVERELPEPPRHAWLRIWTQPRRVVRQLIDSGAERGAWVLAILVGAMVFDPLGKESLWLAASSLALGAAVAIPLWLMGSVLLTYCGRMLGGTGDFSDVRVAQAWGSFPTVVSSVAAVLLVRALDAWAAPLLGELLAGLLGLAVVVAAMALIVWALTIHIRAIAEAHQLSAFRGTAALGLPLVPALLLLVVAPRLLPTGQPDAEQQAALAACAQGDLASCASARPLLESRCHWREGQSCAVLAYLHQHGVGVPVDLDKAAMWLERACRGDLQWACGEARKLRAAAAQ